MIAYYPLEHLYYLCAHSILPSTLSLPLSKKRISLDINWLGLREDRQLLKMQERSLNRAKGKGKAGDDIAEKAEIEKRWDALVNELVVNVGYLPLTIHWSLEKGIFGNPIWEGIFGLIAGIASFRSGWKATALPSLPTSPPAVASSNSASAMPSPSAEPEAPVLVIRD